jgi:signal transduction histidine kinase
MGIILVSQQLRLEMTRADFERRRHLHEEKEQTRALVERVTTLRQERLTWLENLASFLRHELKNQIVAVGTSIELAQSGESPSANQIYLERAQRSLNRMRGLVSSATEATSLEAALAVEEMEQVNLSALVMDRIGAFQLQRPSQQLALKLRSGLAVNGNEARLAQLVDKLLNNAHEHLAEGGEIRIELRVSSPGFVELIVENDGDALPRDKERIFEAFVSSHRTADNLGLGLFVAQSVARNHGGGITAQDAPNADGARFVVTLPAWSDQSPEHEEGDLPPQPASSRARRFDQPPQ